MELPDPVQTVLVGDTGDVTSSCPGNACRGGRGLEASRHVAHEVGQLVARDGWAPQEPLTRDAVKAMEQGELLRCLDSLCHGAYVDSTAEGHDGSCDRQVITAAGDVLDEGAVDFDRRDRQLPEIGERRVSGAEVVERDPDAHLAEPGQSCP